MTETKETICHPHNISRSREQAASFGIRVSVPSDDSFARLLDANWETFHWYATEAERDASLADKRRVHEYSRPSDAPTVVFEAVER